MRKQGDYMMYMHKFACSDCKLVRAGTTLAAKISPGKLILAGGPKVSLQASADIRKFYCCVMLLHLIDYQTLLACFIPQLRT